MKYAFAVFLQFVFCNFIKTQADSETQSCIYIKLIIILVILGWLPIDAYSLRKSIIHLRIFIWFCQ